MAGRCACFVCHAEAAHVQTPAVAALAVEEHAEGLDDLARYDAFAPKVVAIKCALLDFLIAARREGKSVAAYGAAAKGTRCSIIAASGRLHRLRGGPQSCEAEHAAAGHAHPVFGVEAVAERRPDYLMILPWNLRDEVAQQMSEIRDWGGRS